MTVPLTSELEYLGFKAVQINPATLSRPDEPAAEVMLGLLY